MNFDFSEEQLLLRDQARKFLGERAAPARVRRILETDAPYDRELWEGLAEMAWPGTAIPEAHGGAGYGYLELCVIAEELGRSLAPTPFSSSVYLATEAILLAGTEEQKKRWLPRLAAGQAIGCFAIAEGAAGPAAGIDHRAGHRRSAHGRQGAGGRRGRGRSRRGPRAHRPTARARGASRATRARRRPSTATMPRRSSWSICTRRVSRAPRWRPSIPRARTRASPSRAPPPSRSGRPAKAGRWPSGILDRAAVLFAFEQVGGAQAALDMAREYALGRFAFGRPIASFQAIKHKLVDVYVALELARSNAYYAAWALSTDSPELPVAAAAARVSATEAFFLAAKENIQTHGGMGFTWEFDCHMYYRRAKLLALALGSARTWKDRLIARLEARGAA